MSIELIGPPVGNGTWLPAAASVAAVKVYVAETSALIVGVTLLQPRKKTVVPITTSNRGDPPWHWLALASVNDADWNVWPVRPVMSAPAAAFVGVGQFLARCSTPCAYVEVTQPVLPGSYTPGSSAAAVVAANTRAQAAIAATRIFFMWLPF